MWRLALTAAGLLVALTGCDRVFGLTGVGPGGAPDSPLEPDAADTTAPRVTVPRLFAANAPEGADAYLFEGAGTGTSAPAIPVVVEPVGAADVVLVRIPDELGTGWRVCGREVSGESEIVLDGPCRRGTRSLAFTIEVPISTAVGATGTVAPVRVVVQRGEDTYEASIQVIPLDELTATTPLAGPVSGLFSTITVAAVSPSRTGPAVSWRAVADVELSGLVNLDGLGGASDQTAQCGNTGCAGGSAGPGNSSHGATSGTACDAGCAAAGPHGGKGTPLCSNGNVCSTQHRAGNGGGGGNATAGAEGTESSGNMFCGGDITGGDGGAPSSDAFLLAPVGGGGGGAGGTLVAAAFVYGGGGGGGGGVITIDTLAQLRFTGSALVRANGGPGGTGASRTCNGFSVLQRTGHGGGGGGGAIRLRASTIDATADLDSILSATGGSTPTSPAGAGARGRIRVDGLGADTLDIAAPGVVRGPDFDALPAIVEGTSVTMTARNQSVTGGLLYWGVRSPDDTSYTLNTTVAGAGAVSLAVPLQAGLNEVCVFTGAQASAAVTDIPDAAKRCAWVASVL